MTDLQKRKEELDKLEKSSLINRLIKVQNKYDELFNDAKRVEKDRDYYHDLYESAMNEKEKLERKLKYNGIAPARLIVEYVKNIVNECGGETVIEDDIVATDTVAALSWELWHENMERLDEGLNFALRGFILHGVDSEYDEFEFTNVIAFTTPDGMRHVCEGDKND